MKKDKVNVLEVSENKNIHFLSNVPIEENRVKSGEEIDAEFSPEMLFNLIVEPRGLVKKLRLRKPKEFKCVVHRAGRDVCEKLTENKLFDNLTNKESREIVKRNMAIGLGQYSPISWKVALVIIVLEFLIIGFLVFQTYFKRGVV